MSARKWLIGAAAVVAIFWGWRASSQSPWNESTLPAPIPVVPIDAQPVLVQTEQLVPPPGTQSPKPVVASGVNGDVVVVAHGLQGRGSDIIAWQSADRGLNWDPPVRLAQGAERGEMNFDPWLATDRRGRFYLIHALMSDGRPLVRRSKDAGSTWSNTLPIKWRWCDRPVLAISPDGRRMVVAAAMADKTANYPTSPLDANDPQLQEKMKAAFRNYAGIFVSGDHGVSWERLPGPFGDRHAIPFSIIIDDSGRIAATWIVAGDGSRSVVAVSEDRGRTWTETVLVESLQADREHEFNGARFPVVALDGRGTLHVASLTANAAALLVRGSRGGTGWSDAVQFSSVSAKEVRMAAIDSCGPMVHVTWMERKNSVWHSFYRGSRDFGEIWSAPLCLSADITSPDGTRANGFQLFGDDDQSSVFDDGTGRVHAVWCVRGGNVMHAIVDWLPPKAGSERRPHGHRRQRDPS